MIVYRRFRGWHRRLVYFGVAVAVLSALVLVGLFVIYPRVGRSTIRDKVVPKLASKLGRAVTVGNIDVRLGHATLQNLVVAGARADAPLVVIDRIDITFDTLPSLWGSARVRDVAITGVHALAHRNAAGVDDVSDVLEKLGLRGTPATASSGTSSGFGAMRPDRLRVAGITVQATDDQGGMQLTVADGTASADRGAPVRAELHGVVLDAGVGPKGELASLTVERISGEAPTITVDGGRVELWPGMALTGITGTVRPSENARYDLDLAGGYGGVEGQLWTARGHIEPKQRTAVIDLVASKFTLDRLAPILVKSPIIEFQRTSVDADFHVELMATSVGIRGGFHVAGLNVLHPMLAEKPVRGLDFGGDIVAEIDRTANQLNVSKGQFTTGQVPFSITGMVAVPGGLAALRPMLAKLRGKNPAVDVDSDVDDDVELVDDDEKPVPGKRSKPSKPVSPDSSVATAAVSTAPRLDLRLVVPPVDCQRVIDVIPDEAAPYLAGYTLKGTYEEDIHLAIDWGNLDGLVLDGFDSRLGLGGCKVLHAPASSPLRLRGEFEHQVEVGPGEWRTFWVGQSNPDYVPLYDVSPYLVRSLMSTEDSSFYSHHGFITREFATALKSNLKAGRFRHGASSISMQLVKNALLYREKTLSRKLQELFLTWHMETVLSKDRILEIYVNIIEYGPGIYGIGEAAHHYFGKEARDLTPVEAAFFSTILPSPKDRYAQFCSGVLRKQTVNKIGRILDIMHKRGRITEEEWVLYKATPLVFARDGINEAACMATRGRAMRKARPTSPTATTR